MATYATRNNDKVGKLLLYAPQWIRATAQLMAGTGAYRIVQEDAARVRWLTGVPEAKTADLIPPGWFEQWRQDRVRAPNVPDESTLPPQPRRS